MIDGLDVGRSGGDSSVVSAGVIGDREVVGSGYGEADRKCSDAADKINSAERGCSILEGDCASGCGGPGLSRTAVTVAVSVVC